MAASLSASRAGRALLNRTIYLHISLRSQEVWLLDHRGGLINVYTPPLYNSYRIVNNGISMKNGVFWDLTPCGSSKNRRFGGT
jgi:hypothetical protein